MCAEMLLTYWCYTVMDRGGWGLLNRIKFYNNNIKLQGRVVRVVKVYPERIARLSLKYING